MKIKPNHKGQYYAHLKGSNPINLRTTSKVEAERLAKEAKLEQIEFAAKARLLSAEAVQRLSAGGRVTGAKALDTWRSVAQANAMSPTTLDSYQAHIGRFLANAKLRDKPISNATFHMVDEFVNADDGAAAGTRRMRQHSLDNFFRVCSAHGYVLGNPADCVKVKMHKLTFSQKEPKERVPFTDLELDVLHKEVTDGFWRTAILLAEFYGLRLSDVAQLEWDCLSKPDRLVIWTDKRDRRLDLPLHPEVKMLLESLPRQGTYVFPYHAELARDMKRRAGLSVQFSRLLDRLGIKGKSFHCLRHTFATKRAAMGDSVDEIRRKMGHSATVTTQTYIHT